MKDELKEDEIKISIQEVKEKLKRDIDNFNSQRKVTLTWNIVSFIGILSSTIAISMLTKFETFDIRDYFKTSSKINAEIISGIIVLTISFLAGILSSYYKTKVLKNKTPFYVSEFLKEAYLNGLDRSKINPQRYKI